MLLKRVNVLLQTVQENWVGPMRICWVVGIQYRPWVGVEEGLVTVLGRPIWRATVTPLRSSDLGFFWRPRIAEECFGLETLDLWWQGGPREREMESSLPTWSASKQALSEDMQEKEYAFCMLLWLMDGHCR